MTSTVTRAGRVVREAESEESLLQRSYGSRLGYQCGPARQFEDVEFGQLYQERWMQCNWNKESIISFTGADNPGRWNLVSLLFCTSC